MVGGVRPGISYKVLETWAAEIDGEDANGSRRSFLISLRAIASHLNGDEARLMAESLAKSIAVM